MLKFLRRTVFRYEAVASRREHLKDCVSIAAVCGNQKGDGRPGFAEAMKAVLSLHARQIIVNDCQGDAGSILSQYPRQLPEISANEHFREIQTGFDHVKQSGAAKRALV